LSRIGLSPHGHAETVGQEAQPKVQVLFLTDFETTYDPEAHNPEEGLLTQFTHVCKLEQHALVGLVN
jgi:hypothetical protein